jgi:hypothetical protein
MFVQYIHPSNIFCFFQQRNGSSLAAQNARVHAALAGKGGGHWRQGGRGEVVEELFGWCGVHGCAVRVWRRGQTRGVGDIEHGALGGGGGELGRGPATETERERPGSERFEVAESVAEKRVWMLAAFACAAAVVQPRYVLPPPQQGP